MPGNKDLKQSNNVTLTASYSGPLPPAAQFEKYEQVVPGAGARILTMAENQSQHRQELEKRVVIGNLANERLGAIFAFIIAMTGIIAGTFLVATGKSGEGLAAILTPLGGLAAVFFYKTHKSNKELDKKFQNNR